MKIRVQYARCLVYVTINDEGKLTRANLGGDYLDITDKLTVGERVRLERKVAKVVHKNNAVQS